MNRLRVIKGVVRKLMIFLGILLCIIVAGFVLHVLEVNRQNSLERKVTPDSTETDVMIDIHPRGQVTDKWEKDNAFPDKVIYARIYEAAVTNNSEGIMKDWYIRLNIQDDCFINNSWCGKMEIHQFIDGEENIQTIDLRDYEEKDVTLKHFMAGQDLLIPLTKGDYLIYHPDDSGVSGESPLSSSKSGMGQALIGIIMYSESGEVDFSDYTLNYFIKKSYFAGTEGIVYLSLFAIWILIFAFSLVVSLLTLHFEGRLYGSNRMLEESFRLCASIADIKDSYTKDHSYRVAKYARMIAEEMGMDKSDCDNVYYVAMVHDIGNYFVPEQILRKGEKLSRDEYEAVKSHPTKGAELLKEMVSLPYVAEGAMYHHERYDGTGYPMGIKGDDIPLIARIISVADAYDAMNSDRAYRSRLSSEQIKQELNEKSGSQFDPVIVKVFMEIIDNLDR